MEHLEINLHIHGQPVFDSGANNTEWEKDSLFSKWCWENLITTYTTYKMDLYHS